MLVEFYEDYYEAHPNEARKALADKDGEFYFTDTGDPLFDKWEDELRRGLTPDLTEGMSLEAKEQLKKERERALAKKGMLPKAAPKQSRPVSEKEKRLSSQFITPGSRREQELLQRHARQSMLGSPADPSLGDDWEDLLKDIK